MTESSIHPLTDARALSPFPDGPTVTVAFRPPCATERTEIFGLAPHGPEPEWVVKAICRILSAYPDEFVFEPDPKTRGRRDEAAACYVVNREGEPIAHVVGVSFAWLKVAADRLANTGWAPGRNREFAIARAAAA